MAIETSYTEARQNLAAMLDRVTEDRQIVVIRRRGRGAVALVAADELTALTETAHLLRSPKNRDRLLAALERAIRRQGKARKVGDLRREVGLGEDH